MNNFPVNCCNPLTLAVCLAALAVAGTCRAQPQPSAEFVSRPVDLQSSDGAPVIRFATAFDSGGDDTAYDIWPTGDGHFIIAGSTVAPGQDQPDVVVLKVNADGQLQWSRVLGGDRIDIGFGVRVLNDPAGTIVVAGWTHSFGAGAGDFWLIGLDARGEVQFQKTFGQQGEERATSLATTRDGGVLLVGESYSHGDGDSRIYVVRTAGNGELQWERTFDSGPLNDRGLAIEETADGWLLVGNSMDTSSGSTATVSDGLVVKCDREGNELWSHRYGGDEHDILHHVAALDDGQFLLTGYTRGFGANGENDLWLVTIDGDGRQLDSRVVGGEGADHNIMARRADDGAVYLCGYSRSGPRPGWDAELLRLDGAGQIEWHHRYGTDRDDGAVALVPLDNRVLVAGYTQPPDASQRDILLMLLEEAAQ